ncbi:MAG: hypothetical protein K6U78_06455, partial [Anaerolineae bacterium]|nr:hypothetical protein [Anaerolineae bacterium]
DANQHADTNEHPYPDANQHANTNEHPDSDADSNKCTYTYGGADTNFDALVTGIEPDCNLNTHP